VRPPGLVDVDGISRGAELGGGAELEVSDHGGEVVFLAPLARHLQVDETGTLWVRPVVGGYRPEPGQGMPEYAFSLSAARGGGASTL
jgi:hypothetical protein